MNEKAWALYAEFRPVVDGWGKRSEVRCETILGLRNKGHDMKGGGIVGKEGGAGGVEGAVKFENNDGGRPAENIEENEPERKKARVLSLEEYEAILDQDSTFNHIDLNFDT